MTQDEIIEITKRSGLGMLLEVGGMDKCLEHFAKLVAAHEQDRCCAIVYSQCDSDNVAQRTVDAIRGKHEST